MLPSIIFSTAYFIIFYRYEGGGNMLYNIINGCGHMWFLPMLFGCFVFCWLMEFVKIKDGWKSLFLIALNFVAVYHIKILRISDVCIFMVYFYGGYVVYKNADKIKSWITDKRLIIGWMAFVLIFAALRPLLDFLSYADDAPKLYKLAILVSKHICQFIYAGFGAIVFYCSAVYYTQRRKISQLSIKFASCCFGIYLFQQFFLQLLYYKTSFPEIVGPYVLPWAGFVIATVASFVVSALLLKTKIGKFLIG